MSPATDRDLFATLISKRNVYDKKALWNTKGNYTKIEFDVDARRLHDKIEGINDLVPFECEDATQAETAFHKAVDDYLDFCQEVGKRPAPS